MTLPPPTEEAEQIAVVRYLELRHCKFTAVPNESGSQRRDAMIRGAKMKRQGVRKGFPDLVIIANGKFFCIEMKRTVGSSTSTEQKEWHAALRAAGVPVHVCKGFEEAKKVIDNYLVPYNSR